MRLNPKKDLLKRKRETKKVENVQPPPKLNQEKMSSMNLEKLKKSLRELINEKEGGGVKNKTFAL